MTRVQLSGGPCDGQKLTVADGLRTICCDIEDDAGKMRRVTYRMTGVVLPGLAATARYDPEADPTMGPPPSMLVRP